MKSIQFINNSNGKQYFFDFDENKSIGSTLKFVSDFFQSDKIRFYYCSKQIYPSDTTVTVKQIHNEIYFIC
jgi:hypothetical protein